MTRQTKVDTVREIIKAHIQSVSEQLVTPKRNVVLKSLQHKGMSMGQASTYFHNCLREPGVLASWKYAEALVAFVEEAHELDLASAHYHQQALDLCN